MNLLAVDTSSPVVSFAIMKGGRIVKEFSRYKKQGASWLVVYLKRWLEELSLSLTEIDAFIVGAGPGSFTGVRIGFSVIKAFGLALNKPVISISSFLSCAYQVKDKCNKIAVVNEAGRGLVYGATFKVRRGEVVKGRKEKLYRLEEFIKVAEGYTFLTYSSSLQEKIRETFLIEQVSKRKIFPHAKYLLFFGKDYYKRGEFVPLDKLEPLYIFPKECQIRK